MLGLTKFVSKNVILVFSLTYLLLLCTACTAVKPWQKEFLAKPQMSLEPSSVLVQNLNQEAYTSREASSGGYAVGGGGCGCD